MATTDENPTNATTVEQTSKRLKLHQMISVLMIIIGGVWLWTDMDTGGDGGVGALILLAGIIWYAVTRFRIWWHHK